MSKLGLALMAVSCLMVRPGHALPTAYYNPATGNVKFLNDFGYVIDSLSLISPTGRLNGGLLPITGTIRDESEFPFAYTYIDFPPGLYDTGNTVTPLTPIAELSFYYVQGEPSEEQLRGAIFKVPEPLTHIMFGLALIAATPVRRTGLRRVACSRSKA